MRKFLIRLCRCLNLLTSRTSFEPSWAPKEPLAPNSPLARYIYSSKDFSLERVKRRAFMPYYNKGSERLETSVFCVEDLTHDDVKSLSLAARSDNSAKAVAHHQASECATAVI